MTGTGTSGALTEPLPARIRAPAPGRRPGSLKKIPQWWKQCEVNAADPAAVPLEMRPGPLEPVKRNIAEHPRDPRPAPLRDIARQVRHSAPLARAAPSGKVTRSDAPPTPGEPNHNEPYRAPRPDVYRRIAAHSRYVIPCHREPVRRVTPKRSMANQCEPYRNTEPTKSDEAGPQHIATFQEPPRPEYAAYYP